MAPAIHQFAQFCMVTVAGEENYIFDVLLFDAAQQFYSFFGAKIDVSLIFGKCGKHLPANGHEFKRGGAGGQRIDEPVELGGTEVPASIRFALVGRSEIPVVHEEKISIGPLKIGGNAALSRQSISGVCPKHFKNVGRQIFINVAAVAVVGAIIVVVPDGVVMGGGEQRLHLRKRAGMSIAMHKSRPAKPIGFPQIGVIPEPQHEVGPLPVNGPENLVVAAIWFAGAVVGRLIDIGATAECYFESGWIGAVFP